MPGVKRTHPRLRARREAPSALRAPGVLPTVHPWTAAKAARPLAPPRAVRGPCPSALRRSAEGTRARAPSPAPAARPLPLSGRGERFGFCDFRFWLWLLRPGRPRSGSSGSLSAAARAWRKKPAGAARWIAPRSLRHTDVPSANLRSALATSPGRSPATANVRVPFLLVTSLWASKEK